MPTEKASAHQGSITRQQLIDALNEDLSREYQAIIAYVNYSQVLKGAARLTVEGKAYELKTGGVLTLGASIRHEVEALEDTAFLLTISWPDAAKLQAMEHRGYGT